MYVLGAFFSLSNVCQRSHSKWKLINTGVFNQYSPTYVSKKITFSTNTMLTVVVVSTDIDFFSRKGCLRSHVKFFPLNKYKIKSCKKSRWRLVIKNNCSKRHKHKLAKKRMKNVPLSKEKAFSSKVLVIKGCIFNTLEHQKQFMKIFREKMQIGLTSNFLLFGCMKKISFYSSSHKTGKSFFFFVTFLKWNDGFA